VEFLVLGPLEVRVGGAIVPLGGAKQRAALAMLLLHPNEVVSRDRLVDGLWGDLPPTSTTDTLYAYISRLRKLLHEDGCPERLLTRPPGYLLRVDDGELDLQRLEVLLDEGRRALAAQDPPAAATALHRGLALYRGAPLADLANVPFARAEIGRLDELRLAALEQRIEADLGLGRHAELIGELQALVAQHPQRERFWAELMLALYQSGRRGEALDAFDRCRKTLAEQLGMDPGQQLQHLHRQVLDGDPAIAPVTMPTPRAAPPGLGVSTRRRLRRRAIAGVTTTLALIALATGLVLRGSPAADKPRATYRAGTVLLDIHSGIQVGFIPRARLATSAYPTFSGGHFWVVDFDPSAFVEIDPRSGRIMKQITPPPRDPKLHGDSVSLTPFAVQGTTLWTGSGDDLVKMDTNLGREVDRFHLDNYAGGSGITEGVAVGAGSVWVSRDVGRGQIVRLDPVTGRVLHRFDNMITHNQLAFGDGSLWVADESGVARIDPKTNLVTHVHGISGSTSVAAGGGFGWASNYSKGIVYKIDNDGRVAGTYEVGLGPGFMAYTGGRLWVDATDQGTVTGIDPTTGRMTTYRFGHPVDTVTAGGGVLLAQLNPGQTVESFFASFPGKTVKLFADQGELGQGDEAALDTSTAAYQIEYATCAKLLNYPDAPPPIGWQLRPEIARAMPTVSPDGRTYRFIVRPGYRFSPPSDQVVTAATFRYSIERALSPKLSQYPYSLDQPGPQVMGDIEGERAFRQGAAGHISGLRVHGDALSITLTKPSPDFLERLALPYFCPVPIGMPFVPGAPHQAGESPTGGYIDSAGPYYVAAFNNQHWVILKRNPNYRGPRPHALDVIAIREGVDAAAALNLVQSQGWDGITHMSDPLMDPGGALDQRWGAGPASQHRYYLAPAAGTDLIAFNTARGVFADPRVRRAASLALDRRALAATWGDLPTNHLLSPALPGDQHDGQTSPLSPSIAKAKALMHGRTGHAVMPVPPDCEPCTRLAHLVQADLGPIGIEVEVRTTDALNNGPPKHGGRFDLIDAWAWLPYPDSASFLQQVLRSVPQGWIPAGVRTDVRRVGGSTSAHRQAVAAHLAQSLTTEDVLLAAYGTGQTSQFLSPRLGCRVFPPFGYGVDLAALCLARG
jgi:DNA-binding SARP family transcriptional activator/ABC-type transport system substrate-binding protein